MRLVYPVQWSRPGHRACQHQTMATVAALARAGHEVIVAMPRGGDDPPLDAATLRAWYGVAGDFRLVQLRSRWAGEGLGASLMWLRQLFSAPEVRSAELLYCRIPTALAVGQRSPVALAVDHYRPWPDRIPAMRPLIRRTAHAANFAGLVLHSDYAADSYRRIGIDADRLLVAHNGFDRATDRLDQAAARERLGLPADRTLVIYAGRINPAKGLDRLLAVAALRPDIGFALIGSEAEGPVERAAARLANVAIHGWVDQARLETWLAAADLLVIPPTRVPLDRFGTCVLPIKLFAYLAAGRAILAPDSPDTAELLAHGENSWLVPPDQPEAAAAALDRLLGDAGLRDRLGAAALRLSHGLTWDRRAARISDFLAQRLAAIGQRSLYSSTVSPISPPIAGAAQAPTGAGR